MPAKEQTQISNTKSSNHGSQLRKNLIVFLLGLLLGLGLWAILPRLVSQYYINKLRLNPPGLPLDSSTDVAGLISFNTGADLLAKRSALSSYIWGEYGLPIQAMPYSVDKSIQSLEFKSLPNLKEIDRLVIHMDWGINSLAYYFIPQRANGRLFIYHHGHDGGIADGKPVIQTLIDQEYAVIALEMPLTGGNNEPVLEIERFGTIKLQHHNQLELLPVKSGSPVQFLLTPAITVINFAYSIGYSNISMIGISGGGWTTTLVAALDPRISYSYPVAGSLPIHLRATIGPEWGDYEQTEPGLYRLTTYPELYLMGAYGENRRQVQVINQFDPCCFSGTRYLSYLEPVQDRLNKIGLGYFNVFLDSSHQEHKISETALEMVLQDMQITK